MSDRRSAAAFAIAVNLVHASCVDVMDDEESTLDEATIRRFLETGYPKLVAGLAMVSGSRPLAEDAVQEAMARAWERSSRGETIERPEAWVTTVALNLIRSRFRRARAEHRARDRLVPRAAMSPSGDLVDLQRALRALPRRYNVPVRGPVLRLGE
jgi:DNA-directed RNA polymerase specialized sigma24 family protein